MNRIELSGLIGSHPLGALAAFGLLRTVSEHDPSARISFVERDDWVAVLDTELTSGADLVSHLVEWSAVPQRHLALAAFGDRDVRIAPSEYHEKIYEAALADSDAGLLQFLVALAADGAKDNAKGFVKPSPFYMASGQQSFVETMVKICAAARAPAIWQEALFGPWTYATAESSCGWDPGTERLHALRARAPTKDKTTCVAGAVRLAFEALPLFPSFSRASVVHTVGWTEVRQKEGNRWSRHDCFRWPVPTVPITLGALKILVASRGVSDALPEARERGVAVVYESVRHEFGQGYAVFRPARPLSWR